MAQLIRPHGDVSLNPPVKQLRLAHLDTLITGLRAILGDEAVRSEPDELLVYECDGLPQHKHLPRAVVFPDSTEQVSAVLALLCRQQVPFTPRGAGTGLSGGALAMNQGVVIELARMRKILKVDPVNRLAVVQPELLICTSHARSRISVCITFPILPVNLPAPSVETLRKTRAAFIV